MPEFVKLFVIAIGLLTIIGCVMWAAINAIIALYLLAGLLMAIPSAIVMVAAVIAACAYWIGH